MLGPTSPGLISQFIDWYRKLIDSSLNDQLTALKKGMQGPESLRDEELLLGSALQYINANVIF